MFDLGIWGVRAERISERRVSFPCFSSRTLRL